MTDTHLDGRTATEATEQPYARHTAAGAGEAYWFFDSLMVVRSEQPGQPVIIEATVAPGPPADLDAAFEAAARTGQPVIGPPMSEEEAALIAAGPAA
jgi:hypothetical protein